FVQWMLVGVPIVVVGLPLTHLVLTRLVFPVRMRRLAGGRELIRSELARLGPMSGPERRVALVALLTALLWLSQPLLAGLLPGLSDTTIAIFGAVLLFLVPSGRGGALLEWKTAESLPWG